MFWCGRTDFTNLAWKVFVLLLRHKSPSFAFKIFQNYCKMSLQVYCNQENEFWINFDWKRCSFVKLNDFLKLLQWLTFYHFWSQNILKAQNIVKISGIVLRQNLLGSDWCVQKFITHLKIAYLKVYCYEVQLQNFRKIVSHEVSAM